MPLSKQLKMMQVILYLNDRCAAIIKNGVALSEILDLHLFELLAGMKYEVPNDHPEAFDAIYEKIDAALKPFIGKEVRA